MKRFILLTLLLVMAVFVVPANADTIEVPLWGTLSGFNLGEPYRGQTFKAVSGLAEKLTVFLAGADAAGGLNFRVLLTEMDTTGGIHLTNVLFESNILNVPFDRTRTIYTFTVDLGGILLTGGRSYAWVLDSYGLSGGAAPTGICRFDCYADGVAIGHVGPFTGDSRDEHFAGPWLVRHLNDMAFTIEFTPMQIKDKTMPWIPLLLFDDLPHPPTCTENAECSPDSYCAKAAGDCNGNGICHERPEICPDVWDPVCGCDDQTYVNECYAAAAGVNVQSAGECPPPTCTENAECSPDSYCAKAAGDCNGNGICHERPEICPDVWDPVCGCDDQTYVNECYAAAAGVNVLSSGECLNPPTATADAVPSNGPVPLTVDLLGTGTDPDGSIVLYEWDFDGDGTYEYSSPTTGNTSYTYTTPGTNFAQFRVTDDDGLTDTATVVVNVGPPGSPTATASANPTSGSAPLLVSFTGTGTDPDGSIVLYEWDFDGDGTYEYSSPTTGNTSYTYTTPGTNFAQFRVTDDDGLSSVDQVVITVENGT